MQERALAEHMQRVTEEFPRKVADALARQIEDDSLDLPVLAGKPRALWRRALHRWLAATPYRGDLSRQGFAALLVAAMRGRSTRHSLGREGFAVIRHGRLCYKKTRLPSARK